MSRCDIFPGEVAGASLKHITAAWAGNGFVDLFPRFRVDRGLIEVPRRRTKLSLTPLALPRLNAGASFCRILQWLVLLWPACCL
jgi:hypothetical protein